MAGRILTEAQAAPETRQTPVGGATRSVELMKGGGSVKCPGQNDRASKSDGKSPSHVGVTGPRNVIKSQTGQGSKSYLWQ